MTSYLAEYSVFEACICCKTLLIFMNYYSNMTLSSKSYNLAVYLVVVAIRYSRLQ